MVNAPERVSQPINEIHPPELVHGEEVSRAEPHVALLEHVLHNFPLCGALVDVPVESPRGVILDYLADELAGLPGLAKDAEAALVSQDVARLVDADEADRVDEGEEHRGESDRAGHAVDVEHAGVALGGAVELPDALDAEALDHLVPDLRAKSVAVHDLDLVLPLLGGLGRGQEVPADLPDVLGAVALVVAAVLPEVAHAELLADDDGDAEHHHEADTDGATGRVVERQRVVENGILDRAQPDHVVHSGRVKVEARVLDDGRLGHARRPRGVEIQQLVIEVGALLHRLGHNLSRGVYELEIEVDRVGGDVTSVAIGGLVWAGVVQPEVGAF